MTHGITRDANDLVPGDEVLIRVLDPEDPTQEVPRCLCGCWTGTLIALDPESERSVRGAMAILTDPMLKDDPREELQRAYGKEPPVRYLVMPTRGISARLRKLLTGLRVTRLFR